MTDRAGGLRLVDYGPDAVLVEVLDPSSGAGPSRAALSVAAHLRERLRATDVVPGARTVLVDGSARDAVERALVGWVPEDGSGQAHGSGEGPLVEVPVVYDGEDLSGVAEAWGCSTREVVERHTSVELVSAFCGFAPGFAYLAGLPEEWAVPRLAAPRPRVPAGSVALADAWCAVYPGASPGGWRLLGRTDLELWDTGREPPALLVPGTRVRFREVR